MTKKITYTVSIIYNIYNTECSIVCGKILLNKVFKHKNYFNVIRIGGVMKMCVQNCT